MNSGTTPSCVGTAMVAMTKTSSAVAAAEAQLGERVAGERGEEDHEMAAITSRR